MIEMSNLYLSAGDVCEVAGVPFAMLDRWCKSDILRPRNSGRGTGRHRAFSVGDAVAVAVGLRYRSEGTTADRVVDVVRFLAGLGLNRLESEIAAGRTFPVPGQLLGDEWFPGMMIPPPFIERPTAQELMRRIDIIPILQEVKQKIRELTSVVGVEGLLFFVV